MENKRIVLALTGASGSVYPLGIAKFLLENSYELHCVESSIAKKVMQSELGFDSIKKALGSIAELKNFFIHNNDDFFSCIASGSFDFYSMIVAPCSLNTLAKIAAGISDNLILRASQVALKEKRKLTLLLRETPLALNHLKAACLATESGASIVPACPAFYSQPKSIDDLINFVNAKTLSCAGIKNNLLKEWTK